CQHAAHASRAETCASFLVDLAGAAGDLAVAWCAYGPPCLSVYFPVFLDCELPGPHYTGGQIFNPHSLAWQARQLGGVVDGDPQRWGVVHDALARLQARFELEVEEFLPRATSLKRRGAETELARRTRGLMQSHVEQFTEVLDGLLPAPSGRG